MDSPDVEGDFSPSAKARAEEVMKGESNFQSFLNFSVARLANVFRRGQRISPGMDMVRPEMGRTEPGLKSPGNMGARSMRFMTIGMEHFGGLRASMSGLESRGFMATGLRPVYPTEHAYLEAKSLFDPITRANGSHECAPRGRSNCPIPHTTGTTFDLDVALIILNTISVETRLIRIVPVAYGAERSKASREVRARGQ